MLMRILREAVERLQKRFDFRAFRAEAQKEARAAKGQRPPKHRRHGRRT